MAKKIRLIKSYQSEINKPETEYLAVVKEYNEKGMEIRLVEYTEDNEIEYEHTLECDSDFNPIREEIISKSDEYSEQKTFKYDENNKLIEEKIQYQNAWESIKKYERDQEKRCVIITTFDEEGEVEESSEIYYNEKGEIITRIENDEYGKQKNKVKNSFDEKGILISKEEYSNTKKPDKIYHYHYNENGDLYAVETQNSRNRLIDWTKIVFDDKNRPIEQVNMAGTKLVIEYNDEESEITETYYLANGTIYNKTKYKKNSEGLTEYEETSDKITRYVYEYF
ncbi:MAG TPA: hypothetical protein PKH15_09860 [Bacteroidales bacterium]|nr:MAG: hypothetical protein BWX59_00959 [Bacteroidetes bacterium ADurb.Bin028]HNY44980.1 hypothetical protein [Bacteroidales bacterium]HOD89334.1 hypothetical protein [Bacteroidales bacterium]